MRARFQPVWREGEPLRLTYLLKGAVGALRLVIDDTPFGASVGDESVEIIVPPERWADFRDGARVALQTEIPAGWESVATGFLVKEA